MQDLAIIISTTLMYSTPLIYTALGGVFSENSGIVNIGLEGMMTIGAFAGAATGFITGNPWLAFLAGGLAGAFFALIHAFATISFNADHTISGVAINLLAPGFALFISKIMFAGATTTPTIPMENKIPRIFNGTFPGGSVLDTIFNNYATVYLAFILVIVAYYVLYKTKFGLRIRSVGEHPGAADTLGINVSRVRYSAVLISGFLAGLGGASMSLALVSSFRPTLVSGQGYIAMAAVIFGKWRPQWAALACLLFGFSTALSVYFGSPTLPFTINENLLSMIPYVVTLIILVLFVKSSKAPSALGNPYKKGER
ncbi:MAG: ABC transporter permease [Terrisporobacter othiniensis]|uniref:ABC transporter permease n=2 Tax=Peptostreptococcaceae TaxID=186804 RepID=UPI0008F40627|nr:MULTISPECIES: ABC transporter permease [Terrisporobacter]MDU4861923.1 ABC transporter permease [Terrisporobacter othiniensis]MDU6996879.1 ABC transporter permease [Terrisporobacter othiniensis]SFJ62451.1 simple sugar transport system permease protein [Terrisporobacter glycolicus]